MVQELARGDVLRPTTLREAMDFASLIAKSKMIPPQYQGKPADILLAVQMGAELGLAPMQALQNIATINGKPSVYGDAVIGLCRASPNCEDIIETIAGEGDAMTATCRARRRGASEVIATFSVADAKKAGLWGKAGPWQSYPRRMLAMRARGFALRDAFPDVLRGLITIEEARDYPTTDPKDITPKADLDAFAEGAATSTEAGDDGPDDEFLRLADDKAHLGADPFRAWWKTLSKANQVRLKTEISRLQRIAEEADAGRTETPEPDPQAAAEPQKGEPPHLADNPVESSDSDPARVPDAERRWPKQEASREIPTAGSRTARSADPVTDGEQTPLLNEPGPAFPADPRLQALHDALMATAEGGEGPLQKLWKRQTSADQTALDRHYIRYITVARAAIGGMGDLSALHLW